jgi:hypothetical protein
MFAPLLGSVFKVLVCGRERPPLGRGAAPLARCSPPTALTLLGPACCAGHHPSSPFALSGSSVGQRGILRSIHLLSCTCNTSCVRILMLFNTCVFTHSTPTSCRTDGRTDGRGGGGVGVGGALPGAEVGGGACAVDAKRRLILDLL